VSHRIRAMVSSSRPSRSLKRLSGSPSAALAREGLGEDHAGPSPCPTPAAAWAASAESGPRVVLVPDQAA
jgi:hypothetical protein